ILRQTGGAGQVEDGVGSGRRRRRKERRSGAGKGKEKDTGREMWGDKNAGTSEDMSDRHRTYLSDEVSQPRGYFSDEFVSDMPTSDNNDGDNHDNSRRTLRHRRSLFHQQRRGSAPAVTCTPNTKSEVEDSEVDAEEEFVDAPERFMWNRRTDRRGVARSKSGSAVLHEYDPNVPPPLPPRPLEHQTSRSSPGSGKRPSVIIPSDGLSSPRSTPNSSQHPARKDTFFKQFMQYRRAQSPTEVNPPPIFGVETTDASTMSKSTNASRRRESGPLLPSLKGSVTNVGSKSSSLRGARRTPSGAGDVGGWSGEKTESESGQSLTNVYRRGSGIKVRSVVGDVEESRLNPRSASDLSERLEQQRQFEGSRRPSLQPEHEAIGAESGVPPLYPDTRYEKPSNGRDRRRGKRKTMVTLSSDDGGGRFVVDSDGGMTTSVHDTDWYTDGNDMGDEHDEVDNEDEERIDEDERGEGDHDVGSEVLDAEILEEMEGMAEEDVGLVKELMKISRSLGELVATASTCSMSMQDLLNTSRSASTQILSAPSTQKSLPHALSKESLKRLIEVEESHPTLNQLRSSSTSSTELDFHRPTRSAPSSRSQSRRGSALNLAAMGDEAAGGAMSISSSTSSVSSLSTLDELKVEMEKVTMALQSALQKVAENGEMISQGKRADQAAKVMVGELNRFTALASEQMSRRIEGIQHTIRNVEESSRSGVLQEFYYALLAYFLTFLGYVIWLWFQIFKVFRASWHYTRSTFQGSVRVILSPYHRLVGSSTTTTITLHPSSSTPNKSSTKSTGSPSTFKSLGDSMWLSDANLDGAWTTETGLSLSSSKTGSSSQMMASSASAEKGKEKLSPQASRTSVTNIADSNGGGSATGAATGDKIQSSLNVPGLGMEQQRDLTQNANGNAKIVKESTSNTVDTSNAQGTKVVKPAAVAAETKAGLAPKSNTPTTPVPRPTVVKSVARPTALLDELDLGMGMASSTSVGVKSGK
ncbi:hypothetical protein HK102_005600, partial [Quaeritorhiza haematococci]